MAALGHSGVQDKTFENIGFRCMMVQPGFDKIMLPKELFVEVYDFSAYDQLPFASS
jgi:hypothetical protein